MRVWFQKVRDNISNKAIVNKATLITCKYALEVKISTFTEMLENVSLPEEVRDYVSTELCACRLAFYDVKNAILS